MKRCLTLFALLALACVAAPSQARAADEATGILEVRVVRGPSGAPAVGAVVTAHHVGPEQTRRQGTTNAAGLVRFRRLPSGTYALRAHLGGHVDVLNSGPGPYVQSGKSVTRQWRLRRKPVITGLVADSDGHPLPGARVRLVKQTHARRGSPVEQADSMTADDRGVYRFALKEPGRYWVLASHSVSEYRYGGGDRHVRFAFAPNSPNLAGAEAVEAAFDQPEVRRDVTLPWAPDAGVWARVRSGRTGEDCVRCSYDLLRVEGDALYPVHSGRVRSHEPPKSYGVRLVGLPSGRYRLRVTDRRSVRDEWSNTQEFSVAGAGFESYELISRPPIVVSGRVKLAPGADSEPGRREPLLHGTALRGTVVQGVAERRSPVRSSPLRLSITRLPDGLRRSTYRFSSRGAKTTGPPEDLRFQFEPAEPGSYELSVGIPGRGYVSGVVRNGRELTNPMLDVSENVDLSDLRVTISRETAEFSANLSIPEGQQARTLRVLLTPLQDDFTRPARGSCSEDGRCKVRNIIPGRYAVRVLPAGADTRRLDASEVRRRLAPWTREVELSPGENGGFPLSVVPAEVLEEALAGPKI